jgi:hypothetical protein
VRELQDYIQQLEAAHASSVQYLEESERAKANLVEQAQRLGEAVDAVARGEARPAVHFTDRVDENDDVEPLLVCDGVSVDAFNEYVGDGEDLPIGVRFLQLKADGRLLIVELLTWIHEATVDQFRAGTLLSMRLEVAMDQPRGLLHRRAR